jgi:1-acyl-sn-glycerol-3-phosphate acyltransferase
LINLLRSVAFNALFYLNTMFWLIVALPTFVMPYRATVAVAKTWGRANLVLLRVAGLAYEIRGREKIPRGALIVASKHQSAWETFALMPLFDNPLFILKRELTWIPFFGWLLIKGRMVAVDRRKRARALRELIERARTELGLGRQLIISRKARGGPSAPRPTTNTAWPCYTWRKACPAFP